MSSHSEVDPGSLPPDADVRRARRGAVLFLVLVVGASAVWEILLHRTHEPIDRHPGMILGLMWTPALVSIVLRVVRREGFRDVSFRLGGRRGLRLAALAWIFPVLVGLLAYGTAWLTGLEGYLDRPVGFLGHHGTAPVRFVVHLLLNLTLGAAIGMVSAAGEEIGWRGYLLTRLVDARIPRPVLLSGLIWGLWHTPLILSGQYAAGPYPALSALVFVGSILPAAYLHAYVRLGSGSVWPAVVAHGTWNAVIQGFFDRATRGGSSTHSTSIWVGESGVLVVLASLVVAVLVLPRAWPYLRSPRDAPGTLRRM